MFDLISEMKLSHGRFRRGSQAQAEARDSVMDYENLSLYQQATDAMMVEKFSKKKGGNRAKG